MSRRGRGGRRDPVVFIGDSITEAWAFHRAGTFESFGLVCRGYSGWTARAIAARFGDDLRETGAGAVHLLCGVNDLAGNDGRCAAPEEVATTVAGMLEAARSAGVPALVGSLLPASRIPWNPAVTDASSRIAAVNRLLRAQSDAAAVFVDYHPLLAERSGGLREDYGTDGLHPNAAGYAALEPLMLASLARLR